MWEVVGGGATKSASRVTTIYEVGIVDFFIWKWLKAHSTQYGGKENELGARALGFF